jgi:hypothetical protein
MSYVDIVICVKSLPILETWPPIYRGQERKVGDRLKANQVYTHVYFRYTPCLTDFTFEFIRRPISPILSPSSRIFVELTLVNQSPSRWEHPRQTPSPTHLLRLRRCRWISCRKNTGYHATDPKIRTQGAEHGRSWIATKHGDGSLESSNAPHTAERDAEPYPGSGPLW